MSRPVVSTVDGGSAVVCDDCGHAQPFLRLPLFALTGPSGTGKSTVCRMLPELLGGDVVVLEQDLLWVGGLREEYDEHGPFRRTWLRMVATLNQSGRPSVLCGTVAPPELEHRPERPLLGEIHYLALVCDDDVLTKRLLARPAWREWDEHRVAEMLEFNHWVRDNAEHTTPPMRLLDTTSGTPRDTAHQVADWVRGHLSGNTP
nr:AAA family ATPase [Herbihabitans rhizosphaerae]